MNASLHSILNFHYQIHFTIINLENALVLTYLGEHVKTVYRRVFQS